MKETNGALQDEKKTVSVLLVDDHAIWRGGVKSMLDGTQFIVIGEAASGREGLEAAGRLHPQIILLDIRMAGGDGLDALQAIKSAHPDIAVVMLTTYDNPSYIARAVAGGAAGFLLKWVEREELISALQAVSEGETLLKADELMRSLKDVGRVSSSSPDMIDPLSDREMEVLKLVAMGMTNREIGSLLFVAESTVKTHVIHIISKLGVSDRVQAAVWATQNGIGPETT
jgi:DNA-binding NarL/FixJ family response regulator